MKAILLIPAPGDPHGLLAPGKCGAMPPMAWRGVAINHMLVMANFDCCALFPDGDTGWQEGRNNWGPGAHGPTLTVVSNSCSALVLAWDGGIVFEGCDRALRLIGYAPAKHYDSLDYVEYCARLVVSRLGGEVVIL